MKEFYDDLFDIAFHSDLPKTDRDLSSLYRFAVGNSNHPLHKYCTEISLDFFITSWRTVESDVIDFVNNDDFDYE